MGKQKRYVVARCAGIWSNLVENTYRENDSVISPTIKDRAKLRAKRKKRKALRR